MGKALVHVPTPRELTPAEKLYAIGLDTVLTLIESGTTLRDTAKALNVHVSGLRRWLDLPAHSARAREAMRASAQAFTEMADEALKAATTPVEVQVARELAHHWRWRAALYDRQRFGEVTRTEHTGANGGPIQVNDARDKLRAKLDVAGRPVQGLTTGREGPMAGKPH